MENTENREKMENINQMNSNTLFLIQNTLFCDSKHSNCQTYDSKHFTVFMAMVKNTPQAGELFIRFLGTKIIVCYVEAFRV